MSRLFLEVIPVSQFREKSEPTALAAGLEVGRFDLQTVWPMLMFVIDFALKLDRFSCWTNTSRPAASAVGSLFQQLKAHTVTGDAQQTSATGVFTVRNFVSDQRRTPAGSMCS